MRKERKIGYKLCTVALCGALSWGGAMEAWASYGMAKGPGSIMQDYIVTIEAGSHPVYSSIDSQDTIKEAAQGDVYEVLSDQGDGWVEVQVGDNTGYILTEEDGVKVKGVDEDSQEAQAVKESLEAQQQEDISANRRQNLVNYALQFVGGRYVAGGSDPHTGADCSGFSSYVMRHGANVSIARSSGAQSQQGVDVSADQMRPGDLVFYGNGSRVNHVAVYIGNGQVVHASTERTGIKTSPWNYRTPVRIRNVMGD